MKKNTPRNRTKVSKSFLLDFYHETDKRSQAQSNSFIFQYSEYASWGTSGIQRPGDAPRMLTSTLQGFIETEGKEKHRKHTVSPAFAFGTLARVTAFLI